MGALVNLSPDHDDIDRAIEELQRVLPIEALRSIIARRQKRHGKTAELRRTLVKMQVREMIREAK